MASLAVRLGFEAVRTVAFGAISPVYLGIGTAMTRPIRMLIFQNTTDRLVMISHNGIDDSLPLVSNGYLVLDIAANQSFNQGFYLAEGQRFYVKSVGLLPTYGSIYLSTIYGAV